MSVSIRTWHLTSNAIRSIKSKKLFDNSNKLMTELMCDTNIWYKMAEGMETLPDQNEFCLVSNYIIIQEICCNPSLVKNFEFFKKLHIKHLEYNKSNLRAHTPFSYIRTLSSPKVNVTLDPVSIIYMELSTKIMQTTDPSLIDIEPLREQKNNHDNLMQEHVKEIMEDAKKSCLD